ncbi:hypothetical protein [Arenivirga flava]|uniref:Uncharacterized protein n=1 Tax=Arenivirga flava TaxID=1930060 RepID=A0AA37XC42_9MICO|nr:hypothetical protein [Arenivirga flava]GMA29446.1 hypothetical protein GCM10025874_26990 [Arenivirga flava]
MTTIEEYAGGFDDDPGYLDFAGFGPLAVAAVAEQAAWDELLRRGRHGSLDALHRQDVRMRAAASALTGFRPDQISFQQSTTSGLMHAMFGFTGGVALGAGSSRACGSRSPGPPSTWAASCRCGSPSSTARSRPARSASSSPPRPGRSS